MAPKHSPWHASVVSRSRADLARREPVAGQDVRDDQCRAGHGDVLYAVRYVSRLARQGRGIVLRARRAQPLPLGFERRRLWSQERAAPGLITMPGMSLPYAMRTELVATIPAEGPIFMRLLTGVFALARAHSGGKAAVGTVLGWKILPSRRIVADPLKSRRSRRSWHADRVLRQLNPGIGEHDRAEIAPRSNVFICGRGVRDLPIRRPCRTARSGNHLRYVGSHMLAPRAYGLDQVV